MTDILQHFGCLDELTQVIYQGFSRFIILSNVHDQNWMVHLALLGSEGRWWRGVADVDQVLKSKLSSESLDAFATRLLTMFINGELQVDNGNAETNTTTVMKVIPILNRSSNRIKISTEN
jgi:hypothetical protein